MEINTKTMVNKNSHIHSENQNFQVKNNQIYDKLHDLRNINTCHPKHIVLSLDGGGIRGIIQLVILQEILEKLQLTVSYMDDKLDIDKVNIAKQQPFLKYDSIYSFVDSFIGTSAGSINAAALSINKYSIHEIIKIFKDNANKIFPHAKGIMETIEEEIRDLLHLPGGIFKAKYQSEGVRDIILQYLGDTKMSDVQKGLTIVTYSSFKNDPVFFSNIYEGLQYDCTPQNYCDVLLSDAVLGSTAAPGFFKPHTFKDIQGNDHKRIIDGGVYATTPDSIGVVKAQHFMNHAAQNCNNNNKDNINNNKCITELVKDNIMVLSIGTGYHDVNSDNNNNVDNEDDKSDSGGLLYEHIIQALSDGSMKKDMLIARSESCKYFRVNVPLSFELLKMDEASNIEKLIQVTQDYLSGEEVKQYIDEIVYSILDVKNTEYANEMLMIQ